MKRTIKHSEYLDLNHNVRDMCLVSGSSLMSKMCLEACYPRDGSNISSFGRHNITNNLFAHETHGISNGIFFMPFQRLPRKPHNLIITRYRFFSWPRKAFNKGHTSLHQAAILSSAFTGFLMRFVI